MKHHLRGGDGTWVMDWRNLSEAGHIVTAAKIEGAIEGARRQSYYVNIATRRVSSGELKRRLP